MYPQLFEETEKDIETPWNLGSVQIIRQQVLFVVGLWDLNTDKILIKVILSLNKILMYEAFGLYCKI